MKNMESSPKANDLEIVSQHQNGFYDGNEVQASVDDLKKEDNLEECRICLQHDEPNDLLSPCQCSGTLRYVHPDCMATWLNTMIRKSKTVICGTKAHIYCELCHQKISFAVDQKYHCKTCSEFGQAVKEKKKIFIALLLLIIVNLAFFLAILAYILSSNGFTAKSAAVLFPLIVSGMVIFCIVVVSSSIVFFKKFVLNKKKFVAEIYKECKKNGKHRTQMIK